MDCVKVPGLAVGGRWALRDLDPRISYKSVHAVIPLPSGVTSDRFIAARCHMTQLMLGPGLDCSAIRFFLRHRTMPAMNLLQDRS